MDTFEKIRALLAEQLDVDPAKITMDSDIMSDFEADSLDIVDMVMTLEDEFGIEVPDDAIESLRTVGDVVNFVDSHSAEQAMLRHKNRLQICLRPHQLHAARQPPVHARLIRKQSHSLMRQHSLHLRLA